MSTETPTVTDETVVTEAPKLDPKIKKRWIDALTSGKFKQAKSVLRAVAVKGKYKGKPVGYCCLGVLTELFRTSKANVDKYKWEPATDFEYSEDGQSKEVLSGACDFDDDSSLTPSCVAVWAGIRDANGFLESDPKVVIAPLWKIAKYKAKLKKYKIKKSGANGNGLTSLAELSDAGFTFKEIADIIDTYL